MTFLEKISRFILGDPNDKEVKALMPIVAKVNDFESAFEALTENQLKNKTNEFKERLKKGESLDDLLPEAFAVVRESAKRVLKMRHFDVQILGGIVLHQGRISEMKTGEGKTLVATLPAYLNALEGNGVYIVTVNDYLAKRDSEWMGQLYQYLGLTVGLIQSNIEQEDRLKAYQADITFGTNNEFGFDYLRDNLANSLDECCQKKRHYAIIDEVDSILIDEARTPLIISGPIPDSTEKYKKITKVAKALKEEEHYTIDEKNKNAILTEEGIQKVEKALKISNIFSIKNMEVAHMTVQCLKAIHLFRKDVDYVIKNGEVMIVDEFTGRILEGRRYSDGLHQAIEAIEGLQIKEESQTLASITYQNFFRLFPKLSGMTGTASTEEEEFIKIYNMDVVCIPTNKPVQRQDLPDVIYKSKEEKYKAIVKDVKERQKKGQPTLVGTISIETSEILSKHLSKAGITHNVLNAKHHEKEAEIISGAGNKGSVTIATNMAGRGTDIVLGKGVQDLGGLYVIGTARHESRRIDNQLRGRSGRQGDPGGSKFYVSLEDDLMRLFGSDRIASIMDRLGLPGDHPIEHGMITKSIERAQKKVEQYHFGIRKQILDYDDVMDKQRQTVYKLRQDILKNKGIFEKLEESSNDIVEHTALTIGFQFDKVNTNETLESFCTALQEVFPVSNMIDLIKSEGTKPSSKGISTKLFKFLKKRSEEFPNGLFIEVSKMVLLKSLDSKWMDHLHNMDILREGIGLRAYGQRDPLIEYKMEAFDMFRGLLFMVYEETIKFLFRVDIVENKELLEGKEQSTKDASPDLIGRNDPCPCGSGKKHKKCCMN